MSFPSVDSAELLQPETIHGDPGMAESVVSYALRTAETNCISVGRLLRRVVPPENGRLRRGPHVNTKLIMRISPAESAAYDMVQQKLHGLQLATATLGVFHGLCAHQELFRRTLAWSPGFLRRSGIPYYPLVWFIDAVRVCPFTHVTLCTQCHRCGKTQPYLRENMRLGLCISCGASLEDEPETPPVRPPGLPSSLEYEHWVSDQVRSFIEFRTLHGLPDGFSFADNLRWWFETHGTSSLEEASRLVGVPAYALSAWIRRGHKPRLRTVLQICHRLRTGLVGFVLRRNGEYHQRFVVDEDPKPQKRSYRKTDVARLKRKLRQILERGEFVDLPLSRICREQLNAGLPTVYRYCREEALAVAARFKSRRRVRTQQRNETFIREMRAAAIQAMERNRVPRHDNLAPYLSRRSWLWRPWARQALAEIRAEFGFAPLAGTKTTS